MVRQRPGIDDVFLVLFVHKKNSLPTQPNPFDGNAMHQPPRAVIVVDGIVPGGAVIPEGDRALAPLEAAAEFGAGGVAVEVIQQWPAFVGGPAFEVQGEAGVDEQHAFAAVGVADDDWVDGVLGGFIRVFEARVAGFGAGAEDMAAGVDGAQAGEGLFQPVGERVIGG